MEFDWLNSQIIDKTSEIIMLFDDSGDVLFANTKAYEMLEYREGELESCNLTRIFRQEFQAETGEYYAFDKEKIMTKPETALYRKNSSCFTVSVRFFCAEKEGLYYFLAQDITGQKDTELRIRQLKEDEENNRKERLEFTANITHELRTPVNGIKGHVTALMEQVSDAEERKKLDVILYCCDNMSSIINNILDFSKLESGKFTIDEQEFDFYKMMEKVLATHEAAIYKKELQLKVFVDKNIPQMLIGDELRLNQILNNLLSNAVKFTSVGHISIDVSKTMQTNDEVELFFMVQDSGIGISKEEQDRLFQSFSQADASITRRFGGTGLGLSITKQLVEMMNGSIRVQSEKGKGSTFSFYVRLKTNSNIHESQDYTQIFEKWDAFRERARDEEEARFYQFGTDENKREIKKRMEKLVLSIELGAWEKAEMLAETIKTLLENGDGDLKSPLLRMSMAIRKENYERSIETYGMLKGLLEEKFGTL